MSDRSNQGADQVGATSDATSQTDSREPENLDAELKRLEVQKRKAEIENLTKARRAQWLTPSAIIALISVIAGFGTWIARNLNIDNTEIERQLKHELNEARKEREDLRHKESLFFQEQQALFTRSTSLSAEISKLIDQKADYARETEKAQQDLNRLHEKEAALRRRNDAVKTIEEHGGLVRLLASDAGDGIKWTLAVEGEISESTLHLSVANFELDDRVHEALATLLQLGQPTIVEFRNVRETDRKLRELVEMLNANKIQQLTLWNTAVSDTGLGYLRRLEHLNALVIIDGAEDTTDRNDELELLDGRKREKPFMQSPITQRRFTPDGMMKLSRALPYCVISYPRPSLRDALYRFEKLRTPTSLDDELECAIEALNEVTTSVTEARIVSSTESLDLSEVDVSGGLSALTALPNLDSLILPYDVRDSDFELVAKNKSLRTLEVIGYIPKKELALRHISSMKKLEVLVIPVSDEGLAYLGQLSELKELTLSGFEASDTSIPMLLNLRKLHKLNVTSISKEGVERLREGLPECQINAQYVQ